MSATVTLPKEPVVRVRVPIKRIVNYYARSDEEAARMKRVALAVLACIKWRGQLPKGHGTTRDEKD